MTKKSTQRFLFGLLALSCAAGLAQLGFWQLQRGQAKHALLDGIDRAAEAATVPLNALSTSEDLRFRAVTVSGQFIPNRQILLDNQLRAGQAGVRIYAPLKIEGGLAVLVDQGWFELGNRAFALPQADLPSGPVQLEGVLLDPPGAGMALGSSVPTTWPLLLTRIDLAELEQRLGLPLLDFVLEDRNAPRAQSIRAGMLPPEKHRGYALQWFGLSLTVLIIYGVLAWRASRAGLS